MLFIFFIFNEESPWEADGTLAVINQSWHQWFCEGIQNWAVKASLFHARRCWRVERCLVCTESVLARLVQTDPLYITLDRFSLPPVKHHILMWREQKITVSFDLFVRGASIKSCWVRALHWAMFYCYAQQKWFKCAHTHSYRLLKTHWHHAVHHDTCILSYTFTCIRGKKGLFKISDKFWSANVLVIRKNCHSKNSIKESLLSKCKN